ncbi:PH domain-containing protein [Mycolicibacterium sp. P9-64]|uniref:PH domain-containing protein n=1 Tax=Mycolicibacterium sp. P9-64 TaxID=2024612 RepID=UPI0011EDF458|nr:PH domain-containing protein [Mycolicibacterium sp. P9-64]KAA0084325.1 PH domain-containing protein [Mycolicibacterium sp. P9-64]
MSESESTAAPDGRSAGSAPTWDLEVRPHLTPYFAYAAAFLIAAAHIAVGFLLKVGTSGVIFQTSDQVAIGMLGVIIGGLVLLFARPRLRVGPAGIAVRNLLTYKVIPWSEVVDVSFPTGARWARVDLPDYEYTPVMAIQAVDKDRAVAAMDAVRELVVRYRPDVSRRSTTS